MTLTERLTAALTDEVMRVAWLKCVSATNDAIIDGADDDGYAAGYQAMRAVLVAALLPVVEEQQVTTKLRDEDERRVEMARVFARDNPMTAREFGLDTCLNAIEALTKALRQQPAEGPTPAPGDVVQPDASSGYKPWANDPAKAAPPDDTLARVAPTWQPIETAPKDGRMVLLFPSRHWVEECDRGEVAYWDADENDWIGLGRKADDYAGPTHWMPLPDPPHEALRTDATRLPEPAIGEATRCENWDRPGDGGSQQYRR